jgi:hypothetical protein
MSGARSHSKADPPPSPYSPAYLRGLSPDELAADDGALVAVRDYLLDGTLRIEEINAEGSVKEWLTGFLVAPAATVVVPEDDDHPLEQGDVCEDEPESGDDGDPTLPPEEFGRLKHLLAERGIVGMAADQALQGVLDSHTARTRRDRPKDRRARDYWGVGFNPHHQPVRHNPDAYRVLPRLAPEPFPPSSARAKMVRQRRAPAAIQRRRVHRERRPRAVRTARGRSRTASRDGPDDLDPSPTAAVAAKAIAAADIHDTFAELRFVLGAAPSGRGVGGVCLLPASMQTAAWELLEHGAIENSSRT